MSPRKAGATPLTVDRIITGAIALIDEKGLDGFSIRALGAALGVDPTSIYYYVPNKSALEDLLLDHVLSTIRVPPMNEGDQVEVIVNFGLEYVKAAMRHPQIVPLLAMRTIHTPTTLEAAERLFEIFQSAGLDFRATVVAAQAFTLFVSGAAQEYAEAVIAKTSGKYPSDGAAAIDPERYPNLARAMAGDEAPEFSESCAIGLRALARGLIEGQCAKLPESHPTNEVDR